MTDILTLPTGNEVFASLPYMPAYLIGGPRPIEDIRLVVEHDMEAPETKTTTENVGGWFANPAAGGSTQIGVDVDSAARYCPDDRRCAGAPGLNGSGVHVEQAGYARQTRDEWLDPYSDQMLWRSAKITASYCLVLGLPVQYISAAELHVGRGITSHWEGTKRWQQLGDAAYKGNHWDPGEGFPWDHFLGRVDIYLGQPGPVVPPQVFEPDHDVVWPTLRLTRPYTRSNMVTDLQHKINRLSGRGLVEDGVFGPATHQAVVDYQTWCHLEVDGIVGTETWTSINVAMWIKVASGQ